MQHTRARSRGEVAARVRGVTNSRPALALFCALLPAVAFAQVDKAEAALRDLEYPDALKALETAKKQVGNDRATTIRINELTAICLATMGQDAKALKAFEVVLSLAPDFKLVGNHPPRVTTVFYEARSWLDSNHALEARQLPAVTKDGLVTELKVAVVNDPLKLIKEVKFAVLADGKVSEVRVPVTGPTVIGPAHVQRLSWWAVLLGEKESVLKELASAASPRIEAAAPLPVAVKPEPVVVAAVVPEEQTPVITEWVEPARPMPAKRIASFALMGGGAAVAGLGIVFGAMSAGTKAKVTGAATDSSGRVTGLTQRDALALDAQQRTEASLANVFIITGVALAAGGATLLIFSLNDTQVALVPTAGGMGVVGTF